jgi:hypothetical protein
MDDGKELEGDDGGEPDAPSKRSGAAASVPAAVVVRAAVTVPLSPLAPRRCASFVS